MSLRSRQFPYYNIIPDTQSIHYYIISESDSNFTDAAVCFFTLITATVYQGSLLTSSFEQPVLWYLRFNIYICDSPCCGMGSGMQARWYVRWRFFQKLPERPSSFHAYHYAANTSRWNAEWCIEGARWYHASCCTRTMAQRIVDGGWSRCGEQSCR